MEYSVELIGKVYGCGIDRDYIESIADSWNDPHFGGATFYRWCSVVHGRTVRQSICKTVLDLLLSGF